MTTSQEKLLFRVGFSQQTTIQNAIGLKKGTNQRPPALEL